MMPAPPKQAPQSKVVPSDALAPGAHMALRVASQHKKQVSAVLHLKKESVGHRGNPSVFHGNNIKAFPRSRGLKIANAR